MTWAERIAVRNDMIRESGRWRAPRDFDGRGLTGTRDGRAVVSFASNDYLGLTAHPTVVQAAHEALDRWGAGSGSARLIVGSRPVHGELEAELAAWKGCEAAALFPTGFAANLGTISALAGEGVTVCSDELNHASIIDGCRMARAKGARVEVWRHKDLAHLEHLLDGAGHAIVVTDTVFSMDGDAADVARVRALCAAYGALLIVDEAHAVLGPDVAPAGDVLRVGTLSKTLGSLGGFVAGPTALVDYIVNTARPYIFTTALTPADAGAARAALRVLRSPEGAALTARLRVLVDRVAGADHPSPIVPVVIGDEAGTVDASAALLAEGLLVPAIRPPTVPPGTSRLRVTLSAAHSDEQVALLVSALENLRVPSAP